MTYKIVENITPLQGERGGPPKSEERVFMELLKVDDGFWVNDRKAMMRCHYARYQLAPKIFSIVRDPLSPRWQIRRTE